MTNSKKLGHRYDKDTTFKIIIKKLSLQILSLEGNLDK